MTMLNIHGWEHLAGDNPSVVAVRENTLLQLGEVPESHRANWEKRLRSKQDHPHFSVRLELYLHHFFKERGWEIDIEPELPGTRNRPDFRLSSSEYKMLVEAKTLLDPKPVGQQDTRLKTLADELSGKLSHTVSIHPYFDLPPGLPHRHIAAEIEKRASEVEFLHEFRVAGEHQGYPYELEVTIILDEPTQSAGVGVTVGLAQESNAGQRMRDEIIKKAGKYGKQDVPLVIAVWPYTEHYESGPDNDDHVALAGDKVWSLPTNHRGEIASSDEIKKRGITEQSAYNGVFNLRRNDGTYRYSHVSAVAIYLFRYDWDNPPSGRSSLRVYHNPDAECPVDSRVFQGTPQGKVNLNTGKMEWTY